jgi:hypothetical protein
VSHKFTLGQAVTYLASTFEASTGSGRWTITQLMPADDGGEYQYTVQRQKTGELRQVRETQLRSLPIVAPIPPPPPTRRIRASSNRIAVSAAH